MLGGIGPALDHVVHGWTKPKSQRKTRHHCPWPHPPTPTGVRAAAKPRSAELANYVRQNCHNGLARRDALREPHRESYRAGQRAGGVATRRQRSRYYMERAGPLGRSDSATSTAIRGQRQNRRRTPETRASRGIACSPPPGETIAARAGASSALRLPKRVIMGTSGRPTPVGGCRPAARHSLGACSSGPAKRCAPRSGR